MTAASQHSRAAYRASGHVNWLKFVPGLIVTGGLAIALAWLLFWALQRGFYLIFVAPLIASFALAGVWYLVLSWSQCRNKLIALRSSVILGLVLYLGYFHFGLLQIVGMHNAHRFDLLPRYIQLRMRTDVARDARHPNPNKFQPKRPDRVQQAFNWFFFGGELILVAGVVNSIGNLCVSRAYCETCSRWMKSESLKLPPHVGRALWHALEQKRYEDVHTFLTNTSHRSSVGCNVTVEHCPYCAAGERPLVVYLTVKDLVEPGAREPIGTKFASLFKPRWSAGLRPVITQIELLPDEIAPLAMSFADLKHSVKADPDLFAELQAVSREMASAREPMPTHGIQRFARIQPVEPGEAGTVLTRRNAILQTVIGVVSIFGGFVVAFAPALILGNLEPEPPGWVMGTAVAWLFGGLVLNLAWILLFPTFFTTRFMLRQTRNAFEYRPSPAVDLRNPDLVFVDIVPRSNWGKQMMENATDIGFLEMNKSTRELVFEGDRERYWIPVESILEIKHEFWAEAVQHQLQSAPTLHHHVVVRAQTADGPWETWFSRRQDTLRLLTAGRRLADATELEAKIRELMPATR